MRSYRWAWLLLVTACTARGSNVREPHGTALSSSASWTFPRAMVDASTAPCDDFYQHACGGWLATAVIPPDAGDAFWQRDEMKARAELALRQILEEGPPANAETERLRTFFASCMDEASAERSALQPLQRLLDGIEAIKTRPDVERVMRELHAVGIKAFFDFSGEPDRSDATRYQAEIFQSWVALPAPKDESAHGRELRRRYREHLKRVLALSGVADDRAAGDADAVLEIEKALAVHEMEFSERFDPASEHPHTLTDLQRLAPHLDWTGYLAFVGYPPDMRVNVTSPSYMTDVDHVLASAPVNALRAYLRWSTLRFLSSSLPARLATEIFQYSSNGEQAPSRRTKCRLATLRALGVELSRQFGERHLGPIARAKASAASEELRAAIIDRLAAVDWLSSGARAATVDKIRHTDFKMGYPDAWPVTGTFAIRSDTYFENVLAARAFEQRREWDRARAPRSRAAWEMTIYPNGAPGMAAARLTIPNAFPDAFTNSMIVFAAELQPPVFDTAAPREVHYGAFGGLIGHELVHVLETHEYDGVGATREMWTAQDVAAHDARTQCVVAQADEFVDSESRHLHGAQTLGENVADLGGVVVAYQAMKRDLGRSLSERAPDGITREQRFFYAYAQGWCTKERPEAARSTIENDGHAPARFRVNGPLANMPEFAAAFRCAPGSKMTRPAAARCVVW